MTKENNQNFESSTKCRICDNTIFVGDVIVRDHCHGTGKYRGAANRNYNMNISLNFKIPMVFVI